MKFTSVFLCYMICGFTLVAQVQPLNEIIAIKNVRNQINKCLAQFNIQKEVSFYTNDYIIQVDAAKRLIGKEAYIQEYKTDTINIYVRTPHLIKINLKGDYAYESGKWKKFYAGNIKAGGNYTAAWHKEKDNWKVSSEIYITVFKK